MIILKSDHLYGGKVYAHSIEHLPGAVFFCAALLCTTCLFDNMCLPPVYAVNLIVYHRVWQKNTFVTNIYSDIFYTNTFGQSMVSIFYECHTFVYHYPAFTGKLSIVLYSPSSKTDPYPILKLNKEMIFCPSSQNLQFTQEHIFFYKYLHLRVKIIWSDLSTDH